MQIYDSVLDLIGNTPLVRLNKVTQGIVPEGVTVVAKVEYVNPGGSVKDRIAERMIDAAEKDGSLQPGGTIVEPTSGNTGVGLAMVAQQRGYKCIFVCPDKVSEDKRNVLKAYGAQVVVCPTAVDPEDPRSYYETTGPEIWEQTDGMVTHFVAGVGTGGTISGTGRYLKEASNSSVKIIGADPEGSVYSGGSGRPYLVEGVGEDFWPTAYDPGIADEIVAVSDRDSFDMTRRMAREEGLLVGGSCGMAVVAALRVAAKAEPGSLVVVLLPDSGRGYLSKVFNEDWLSSYGFIQGDTEQTIGDVLRAKTLDGDLPDFVHTHPTESVADAIAILKEYGVSQIPVVRAEPPIMTAEISGSIVERVVLDALFHGTAHLSDRVESVMSASLPMVGAGESVAAAMTALAEADALMVVDDGKPTGVITRQDVLAFLAT